MTDGHIIKLEIGDWPVFFKMANHETDPQKINFDDGKYLSSLPKIRESLLDPLVKEAMHGCASFSPNETEPERVSYGKLFRNLRKNEEKSRVRSVIRDQNRNLMTGKPGHYRD